MRTYFTTVGGGEGVNSETRGKRTAELDPDPVEQPAATAMPHVGAASQYVDAGADLHVGTYRDRKQGRDRGARTAQIDGSGRNLAMVYTES